MKAEALALRNMLSYKALSPNKPQPLTHTHLLLTLKSPCVVEMQKKTGKHQVL